LIFGGLLGAEARAAVESVSSGGRGACAVRADGTLWCWGYNNSGQLGDGATTNSSAPVAVAALGATVTSVSVGQTHACATKGDHSLWCWGRNTYGALGNGTTTDSDVPVQVTALGTSVAEVAAGFFQTCARKIDGTVWCWGTNSWGQLGNGTTADSSTPVQVTALGNAAVQIALGDYESWARKADGTLWGWGYGAEGELGTGQMSGSTTPVQVTALGTLVAEVASGGYVTCARLTDGTMWCWGMNGDAKLGNGTTQEYSITPEQVTALGTNVAGISSGEVTTCARKVDGTLWCWGVNADGEVGDGTTTVRSTPQWDSSLGSSVAQVSAGSYASCALKADGTVWCWGMDDVGQLGSGTTQVHSSTPLQVPGFPTGPAVAATGPWLEALLFLGLLGLVMTADLRRRRAGKV
jgi:alpha-tubulin suppressor-like RCC1 family protein